jgi:hypothetical protein
MLFLVEERKCEVKVDSNNITQYFYQFFDNQLFYAKVETQTNTNNLVILFVL